MNLRTSLAWLQKASEFASSDLKNKENPRRPVVGPQQEQSVAGKTEPGAVGSRLTGRKGEVPGKKVGYRKVAPREKLEF